MSSVAEVLSEYKAEKDRLAKVEKALEIQKGKVSSLAKKLMEAGGKGPHDLGDGKEAGYIVCSRGDGEGATFYLMPAKAKKAATATA